MALPTARCSGWPAAAVATHLTQLLGPWFNLLHFAADHGPSAALATNIRALGADVPIRLRTVAAAGTPAATASTPSIRPATCPCMAPARRLLPRAPRRPPARPVGAGTVADQLRSALAQALGRPAGAA